MDRLNQLRGAAGGSRDSTLDASSPPSEAFMTANESSSKYFSMSEDESAFDITPLKDVSLASTAVETERTLTDPDQLINNLSPINKKNDLLDSYKIGKQIEAANILSGGVDIFDDNDNSYDGNELIIDDNVEIDNKSDPDLKIIASGQAKGDGDNVGESVAALVAATASNKSQAMLRIGDKMIEAIDIGNGLYMYRQEGQEELEAVQFSGNEVKFLKVRENGEGNLEIYEEIQVEVPKEVPSKEKKNTDKNVSHVTIKDINKVKNDTTDSQVAEKKDNTTENELTVSSSVQLEAGPNKDTQSETKCEGNVNGKMKFSEARKSPVIGSFTPMTYHSTPNKEGVPLTKTMVDLQLHPTRHTDNIKKTIEVHSDSSKFKSTDTINKTIKDVDDKIKTSKLDMKITEKSIKNINNVSNTPETNVNTDREVPEAKGATVEKPCVKESNSTLSGEVTVKSDNSQEKVGEISTVLQSSENIDKDKEATENNKVEYIDSPRKLEKNKDSEIQIIPPICAPNNASLNSQNKDENTSNPNTNNNNSNDKSLDITNIPMPNNENKAEKILEDQNVEPSTSTEKLNKQAILLNTETTKNTIPQLHHKNTTEYESKDYNLESKVVSKPSVETLSLAVDSKSFNPENNITSISAVPKPPERNLKEDAMELKDTDKKSDVGSISNKRIENQTILMKRPLNSLTAKNEINEDLCTGNIAKKIDTKHIEPNKNVVCEKLITDKKDSIKPNKASLPKPINNNHAAVPFGKWTEANRQEFLNKIKESKVPVAASNGKQIKNSNDLNRRDVLKKIDSQRQTSIATAKAQEIANSGKLSVKKETPIFASKSSVTSESKIAVIADSSLKNKPVINKKTIKEEFTQKSAQESPATSTVTSNVTKKETAQRKEINNQDLIDKTIEDLINRSVPVKVNQEDTNQEVLKESKENSKTNPQNNRQDQPKPESPSGLDEIEMQMNKLHGIPFVERPPHELPQVSSKYSFKTYSKAENEKAGANRLTKVPKLLPFVNKNQQKIIKENAGDIDSEEEIIEHEPITGDIELDKKTVGQNIQISKAVVTQINDASKKDTIITENEFDKFARRNSITYENCLKLNYDGSEKHNVIQTVVEKDNLKIINNDDILQVSIKSPQKQEACNVPVKVQSAVMRSTAGEEVSNKKYHHSSKVKMAYQSVMTVKRQLECPITIIEDKPVKVLYVDSSLDYYPSNLNVQGKDLVPITKHVSDIDTAALSSCDSLDADVIDSAGDNKLQDEAKTKSKHQRKQVLTPVDTPELELIEPEDLGFNISPKKKRKTEDYKTERNAKTLVPKKSYLLGRSTTSDDKIEKSYDFSSNSFKDPIHNQDSHAIHNDAAASAIDSLVKAAALIETQSENIIKHVTNTKISDTPPVTPIKRGRGRPRKYPLPEGNMEKNIIPSPQKKIRLIDAKVKKIDNDIGEDYSSSDEIVTENWTMGKINENIVCPICSKLFRSENVVFKHVKHCTGPSPNRSDSDQRSPRRRRQSHESEIRDSKDKEEPGVEDVKVEKTVPKKRKSKDSPPKLPVPKDDVIVIEDTPTKEKLEKRETKSNELKKIIKNKAPDKTNLVCEFCGKMFRQLSYLFNHKLQHLKEDVKKNGSGTQSTNKSVFNCEVCHKEFRKLHHLVQHRIIHNPSTMSARLLRKSSSEQRDNKTEQDLTIKQNDDLSAGFRCEPCDKSFRKLHHLVEHRETHDGINRQKNTLTTQINIEKPTTHVQPPPQCDVCKKSFRKLHHLIEHKEQHLETSSEKSDDKSVKSSLSTKDIIHECSLCYMVFPNEHSLTKHAIICQRKKRQSVTKSLKSSETEEIEENVEVSKENETKKQDVNTDSELVKEESINGKAEPKSSDPEVVNASEEKSQPPQITEKPQPIVPEKDATVANTELQAKQVLDKNVSKNIEGSPKAKIKKTDDKVIVKKTPKKKIMKEKSASTVTKRQKTVDVPLPVVDQDKRIIESSDDDEVRYMLNPDFKIDNSSEGKLFMKVRAKKRNSLQIERPNSKDLVKRRISLQHPPKIPRLKPKPVENKRSSIITSVKNSSNAPIQNPMPSTDSDDNDIKYSFPKKIPDKTHKSAPCEALSKDEKKKTQKKSVTEKRKSLSGIAKRKSMGKMTVERKVKLSPVKPIKRRTAEVEHRCDCGQLFSSAALLARHTSLAHTPPRIRRRRSPPPDIDTKTVTKPVPRKSPVIAKSRLSADLKKSSVKSDVNNSNVKLGKETKKSSVNKSDVKTRKSVKADEETAKKCAPVPELRRYAAHRGVPIPEKMKKLIEKYKNKK